MAEERTTGAESEAAAADIAGDERSPLTHVVARGAAHRSRARDAADRHTRRVRLFKIALPLLGLAAIVVIGGYTVAKTWLRAGLDVRNVLFTKDGLTMVEPRLSGRAAGRTYDVSAARAIQEISDPKIIHLENVDGRLVLDDGISVRIVAGGGLYDGNHETLRLENGVTLAASNGWTAAGPKADVDLLGGRVVGSGGIRIEGPSGRIEADGLDLTDNGHHAVFEGHVRMTVTPNSASASPTPTEVPR